MAHDFNCLPKDATFLKSKKLDEDFFDANELTDLLSIPVYCLHHIL